MPSLDMCLMAHVVHGGRIGVVADSGVLREHLFDEAQRVYDHVVAHYAKYGKVPDAATVEGDTKVVVPPLSDVKEPVGYYVDKVKERARDNLTKEGVKSQLRAMEAGRTQEAIDAASKLAEDVTRLNLQSDPVDDWTKRADEMEEEYAKAKAAGTGILGVETPWPGLNDLTQGVAEGDFWVMVGRPGEGKTWFLVKMAVHAWKSGKVPLFISMEMGKKKINRRMVAVHMKLNYHDLRRGKLGIGIEDEYHKGLRELKDSANPLYVASARNVRRIGDIAVLVRLFKPDVVFLDGLYKIKPPNIGVSSYWERIQAIANDLQLLVGDINTPMVATTQLRREGGKNMKRKRGASVDIGLEDIAFADAIGQNADVVIGLGSTKRMKEDREAVLMVVKNREDERGAWSVKFDPSLGDFEEIGTYEPSSGPDEEGDDSGVEKY